MRFELTLQQILKLAHLDDSEWAVLKVLLKNGGNGNWNENDSGMKDLRERGLVKKVGPMAYVIFCDRPQVGRTKKTKSVSEFFAYQTLFQKCYSKERGHVYEWTGQDVGLLKKLVANYSIEEFRSMVLRYLESTRSFQGPASVRSMWSMRAKLVGGGEGVDKLDFLKSGKGE